jgi:hypothetical protein
MSNPDKGGENGMIIGIIIGSFAGAAFAAGGVPKQMVGTAGVGQLPKGVADRVFFP